MSSDFGIDFLVDCTWPSLNQSETTSATGAMDAIVGVIEFLATART